MTNNYNFSNWRYNSDTYNNTNFSKELERLGKKPYYDKHGWSKKKRFGIVMLILVIELALFLFVI